VVQVPLRRERLHARAGADPGNPHSGLDGGGARVLEVREQAVDPERGEERGERLEECERGDDAVVVPEDAEEAEDQVLLVAAQDGVDVRERGAGERGEVVAWREGREERRREVPAARGVPDERSEVAPGEKCAERRARDRVLGAVSECM
jgi:hypothetical protein